MVPVEGRSHGLGILMLILMTKLCSVVLSGMSEGHWLRRDLSSLKDALLHMRRKTDGAS